MAASLGVLVLLLLLIYGPIYSLLRVKHEPEFGTILYLHHIAAHLKAGTPLTIEQESYLNNLAPIQSWDYNCCGANKTMIAVFPKALQRNYDLPLIKQDLNKPARIALDLFLLDPKVDFRHMACAGQLIWSINSSCQDRTNIHSDSNELEKGNIIFLDDRSITFLKLPPDSTTI